ncbi:hypothetical protein OEZ85_000346 [Tetradesmus obliquus]|uniref:SBP-type domain-containing protein n=1 Tax=Tetradesmus obliquus TaxID=3088 RepID=A0ABY8UTN5_TETOB|nr:hypothetical protein OEZ85_000346 [Tetradesmus obliquus]
MQINSKDFSDSGEDVSLSAGCVDGEMSCTNDQGANKSKQQSSQKQCQAVGCGTVLTKAYCVKKKLCEKHLKVEAMEVIGKQGLWRFCQQCGKLEELSAFAGDKRSCRLGLQKKREQSALLTAQKRQQQQLHKQRQQQQQACSAPAACFCGGEASFP